MADLDDRFYDRADAHINLSNDQINEAEGAGKVSASMMYANARFSAWVAWTWMSSPEEMVQRRSEALDYFAGEFRKMLEENFDDYLKNFEEYRAR
ncbi:DUF3144 domain-containing protein [Asticcacaulis solisilvae]|uniref:DUF3144 domain-containing protein n=1 Tax=Asticcacaulis solisilvae TaxID=1217274 RepID=UPI003FD71D37